MQRKTMASLFGVMTGLALIVGQAHAQTITWDGNLIYNNSPDSCNEAALSGFTEGRVLTQTFTHNRLGLNTLLVDPSIAGHNFRPTAGSPALCANGQQVIVVPFDG